MKHASDFFSPDFPRIAVLRKLADGPLLPLLGQPGWHVLCDAPMQAFFRQAGLAEYRMTQALEDGAFLASGFTLPCAPNATVVVATRRSESAVAGALRARGFRVMPLFGTLLPRLIAHVPARRNVDGLDAAPVLERAIAIVSMPGAGGDVLAGALARLTGVKAAVHIGRAQTAFAEGTGITCFDVTRWWPVMIDGAAADGVFATRLVWPQFQAFRAFLGPQDRSWLDRQFGKFRIVRVQDAKGDPSADGLSDWLQGTGADVTAVDEFDLRADPAGTAHVVANAVGLRPVADAASPKKHHPAAGWQATRTPGMALRYLPAAGRGQE